MPSPAPKGETFKFSAALPWFHFSGAALVVVLTALFSTVESQLGHEISAGESPGFAFIRAHIKAGLGLGLVYLALVSWVQIRQKRQLLFSGNKWLSVLISLEMLSIAVLVISFCFQRTRLLPVIQTVLLISILCQGGLAFWFNKKSHDFRAQLVVHQMSVPNSGLFLVLLFLFGILISFLEPSWHRLAQEVSLDSNFEYYLRYVSPLILSGVTNVWLGIGMLGILLGFSSLLQKFHKDQSALWVIYFLLFISIIAVFAACIFLTLFYAVTWQIASLNLKETVGQFILFFSVTGGILFAAVFSRIVPHLSQLRKRSLIGIVSLTIGAGIFFPFTWLLAFPRQKKNSRIWFLAAILGACLALGYMVLFGDIFNPWFTAFSYLKGAILKIISVIVAGICVLLIEGVVTGMAAAKSFDRRFAGVILALIAAVGFLPFYGLGKYPEVKAAALQFNELGRVDAAFAREFANALGLDKWIHLGQRPPQNGNPHPWPDPLRLKKTHPSLLPEGFNLMVVVVDALRGDAFHSAGYPRNLTPFLDRWAKDDALSFRRAYSQGGGTFAAFPFLVAGRSRFELYGPNLHRQNLYFKIAQAENIQHCMLMQGFGPRNIFPPDFPVTELSTSQATRERRSATADEVFQSAQNAISSLPEGERFLCFLHLMDVHNDLWKKDGGVDFGDAPRDLYDNNLSYVDRAFSRFITWLKREKRYAKTVILFTSDHGEQFWEHGASLHGHTLFEEEIRIPLILVSHNIRKRFEDVPVIAADMAPTIADLAGYSVDPSFDDPHMGISLLPLVKKNARRRYLKRDVTGRASFKRRYFLYRDWEWKLIYFAELDLLQLFNVLKDPQEKNNLLNENPLLAAKMERDLLDYLGKVEGKTYRRQLSGFLK